MSSSPPWVPLTPILGHFLVRFLLLITDAYLLFVPEIPLVPGLCLSDSLTVPRSVCFPIGRLLNRTCYLVYKRSRTGREVWFTTRNFRGHRVTDLRKDSVPRVSRMYIPFESHGLSIVRVGVGSLVVPVPYHLFMG